MSGVQEENKGEETEETKERDRGANQPAVASAAAEVAAALLHLLQQNPLQIPAHYN